MTWALSYSPRDWQKIAIKSWIDNKHRGIAKVVTGGGKTFFALMCVKKLSDENPDLRFFIVVPTVALRDQWTLEIIDDLGVPREHIYSHGMDKSIQPEHRIALMVINSARTHGARITEQGEWMLIVDECHRAASEENRKAMEGDWVSTLGLSATPERQYDDWFNEFLIPVLGNVISDYDYVQAKKDGVISDFKIRNYLVPMLEYEEERMKQFGRSIAIEHARLKRLGLVESRRLMMIRLKRARYSQKLTYRVPLSVKIADNFIGKKMIVFHESIDKANQITKLFDKHGFRVAAYHSKLSPLERLTNLEFFRQGIKDVLVTCRALDEGLNVKDVEIGIIVASTKSTRQRIQRMGRILRSSDDKDHAVVITLYASSERNHLLQEAKLFKDVAEISWYGKE